MTAFIIIASVLIVLGMGFAALRLYSRSKMNNISAMSFEECLNYTLNGSENGIITVGVIRDGKSSYTAYGKDGRKLSKSPYRYEIGSITKTFTATMIAKAAMDGKIDLAETIDKYLSLPKKNTYPTISDILTHSSGLSNFYIEAPMVGNFFSGKNSFYGISKEMIRNRLSKISIEKKRYGFCYSNFGYAVLGLVLESVYGEDYETLISRFAANYGLSKTKISSESEKLKNGWDWKLSDGYMPAGSLVSDIEDVLKYAALQLDGGEIFIKTHTVIKRGDASNAQYKLMGIYMDAIGMAWLHDEKNGFIWHNGATSHYNSHIGIDPKNSTAVVILSNLSPNYRIPATVLGVKLLNELKQ